MNETKSHICSLNKEQITKLKKQIDEVKEYPIKIKIHTENKKAFIINAY